MTKKGAGEGFKACAWTIAGALLLCLMWGGSAALSADPLHNIDNHYGERAPGLAGAYTALSDDPSGALYNPAGLAFVYNDYISISASNYRGAEKTYLNVFGPDQNYSRSYENYFPNFFGAVRDFGDFQLAFVLANPRGESYDQSDRIQSPLILSSIGQINIEYSETNTALQIGPAVAWRWTDDLALGLSLLFHSERSRVSESVLAESRASTLLNQTRQLRSQVRGVIPVIGLQYALGDTTSLGLSLRKLWITTARRSESGASILAAQTLGYSATFIEADERSFQLAYGGTTIIAAPALVAEIPDPLETRAGFAWFPNNRFLLSLELIHTDGFRLLRDRTAGATVAGQSALVLRDREEEELYRTATLNGAMGVEYYITERFSLRAGAFTNHANSREIKYDRAVLSAIAAELFPEDIVVLGPGLLYQPSISDDPTERAEHIDLRGYTFGIGLSDASSSFSVTGVYEHGSGGSRASFGQAIGQVEQSNFSLFVVASLRR